MIKILETMEIIWCYLVAISSFLGSKRGSYMEIHGKSERTLYSRTHLKGTVGSKMI